jgi:HD-GYP domain-containing protein (c-di-GMP phosphodiesterase class II)
VLAKPDILSLNEMQVMRQHPTFSRMVLEAASGLDEMAEWVGGHHERLDGKGYPEMLEDGTIPLEARILAVVDTYVAVTSERPYRSALSDDDAIEVLQGGSGTQLDPKLVQLFIALPPEVRQAGATRPPRATRGATATSSRTAPRSRRTR